ncbi:sigma factor-like helix-turn-helix DNA-binding protein [Lentibacillus sp. L22]|uniref:sigma factor-like helix-turn-helix DNA-binding protein n=1 Tax=Lentibacillus TaxID=175304 RepID=UPI0022B10B17|nr:sigma factor-like helix-turn-helix DNA-binding protein [Lentibacillus daqui]
MRYADKHWNAQQNKDIYGVDLHRFMELENSLNHLEIAQELGISLGEVKMLKKKIIRA